VILLGPGADGSFGIVAKDGVEHRKSLDFA
jgi:hypothetical protein